MSYNSFDEYYLRFCSFLSLRDSSFNCIDTHYLQCLIFIDIASCKIRAVNLRDCVYLKKVAHDTTQEVIVNINVEIQIFYFTAP